MNEYCHGPDEQEARLRVDQRGNLLRGGDSELRSIVPGEPEKSYLVELLRSATTERAQCPTAGGALSAAPTTAVWAVAKCH
jgi:hypothetical protein